MKELFIYLGGSPPLEDTISRGQVWLLAYRSARKTSVSMLQPTGRNVWAIMPNSKIFFRTKTIRLAQGQYATLWANVIALNKSIALKF